MLRQLILIDPDRTREDSLASICEEDFDLSVFPTVERALEEIPGLRPHGIIVIDDDRPEGIIQALRASEPSRNLPIVVVSADLSPERESQAFRAGADDFISKGSDPEVIRGRVLGSLRQSFVVRRLESRLKEMDFLVRMVGHDLKNPIGSILSCAELLGIAMETGDAAEASDLAAIILRSSRTALDFLDDLLGFLRNGLRLSEVEEVPAADLIAEALQELSVRVEVSGASISLSPDLPRVVCDRRRLVQVFTNLIGNAIKYVPKGVKPIITINAIETPHANTIVVADNGVGMDPRDTKRIFQPFVRLAETSELEGTGLGLAIVQRIVEAHEGEVFARSRKGKGSEFYVVLPTRMSFVPAPKEALAT